MSDSPEENKMTVITLDDGDGAIRSIGDNLTKRIEIDVDQLAINVNLFITQMSEIVAKSPDAVGNFSLKEVEVSAEINGKGQVVLWGVGGEIGAAGGLKFIFKRE